MSLDLSPADLSRAFGRDVSSYEIEAIDPHLRIHSVTGGVYRVRVDEQSCVIKVVRHGVDATADGLWQSGADVNHRNYWKREWLAFDSGLLGSLPGRLRAPRALLTTEYDDKTCWIWMEAVDGRTESALTLADLDAIAYALGTTQAAYASGRVDLPRAPWLSRSWLRGWVDVCTRFVGLLTDDDRWTDPRLAPLLPLRERVAALWSRREDLLAVADEPPMTIVHWDFVPANLYVTQDGGIPQPLRCDTRGSAAACLTCSPTINRFGSRSRASGATSRPSSLPRRASSTALSASASRSSADRVATVITAIVFIQAAVERIPEVAEEIAQLKGVSEVYSVTGEIDLIALVRVRNHEEIADVVADRLNKVDGVLATETHVAFRAYSQHDLEAAFALGLDD